MHILTREALYQQVWTTPLSRLAETFGTNGSWLKKLCREAGIPLPSSGHWSKLRSGRTIAPTPLPTRPPGASVVVTIGHYRTWWRSEREMLSDPQPLKPEFPESVETIVAHAMTRLGTIRRPPKSKSPERRRLDFLDVLHSGLHQIGAELCISRQAPGEISVRAGATILPVTLAQQPDGQLRLAIPFHQHSNDIPGVYWDDQHNPLENQLSEIITTMMTAAETDYRAAAMRHYASRLDRLARAEADARQRSAKAKRLLEQRRIERAEREKELLLSQAANWREAHDVRGFVADVLKRAETETARLELAPWAEWALHQADLIDPVKQGALCRSHFKN